MTSLKVNGFSRFSELPPVVTDTSLIQMEAEVLHQEALLGPQHPVVGKYWLSLSRAYQERDPALYAVRAEHALIRSLLHPSCLSCGQKASQMHLRCKRAL